ncbi:TPA: LysR family transcriptional regulator [Vibrio parahaemolyticus]|uniref:LysR family transcriptional regulator n=1 Tax=Vibrio parahaemolyticus TaxID=670 RepID=UPI00079FFC99|nr:LysR family transcriptional regulator [Vibrio parahaemolyticus]EGQ8526507.1 LysR family transcriptional regulator [Vibrio parahaemolyticus]EGQ9210566.1 LysR family transcriptional regulator [Vibrio parahaemolyticus]EGQ9788381.1 LysR family transcriptional regulator [Vibrio parahaemolyticus]EGQ9925354.1 LysR family transcriptional regulator [Vibrio parahaemolyticus]EGR0119540.1 LysR family transcriptional regulator [Vibrio parahaemolyticus]
MFTLQQLETLVTCVECGSFSAAARKLGKAQSAISTAIANLEIDTDTIIFDRSSRTPQLTQQGKRLYSYSLNLLNDAYQIDNMMKAFSSGVEDKLTIAINALLLTPKFYDALKEFYALFPFTQLNLNVVKNSVVADMVAKNEADIGFMLWAQEPPRNVELGSIGYISFSIAVHYSHPLLSSSNVVFNKVKNYHQVLLKDSHLHYNTPLSKSDSIVNNLGGVIELIKINNNWSLLPHHIINHHSDLRELEIAGEEKDWLLQVDRVTSPRHGKAIQWFIDKSKTFYT